MKRLLILLIIFVFTLVAVLAQDEDDRVVTIVTYDSFVLDETVQAGFESATGITIEIVRLSDAGAMLNQVILTQDNPLGDVVYGVDNTFLSRALTEDLFVAYESPALEHVPGEFQLDGEEFRVTPVTFGDVCLNYDVAYFEDADLPVPSSLQDLTDEQYADLLVVQNPATSSPGLAFLLATIAEFGEAGDYTYLDFWRDLDENGVLVVPGWTEAYYGEFSAGSEDGQYPLVVSYASSPPVEVLFGEIDVEDAPTGAVIADGTCFRQIEFAGILDGTEDVEAAQQVIDFLLGIEFQESLPLNMFVFPVNEDAELPELFTEMVTIPENPASLDYDAIEANREDWIQSWTRAVLR